MVKALVAATLLWPVLAGTVVWHRATQGEAIWTALVHVAASRICHQQPSRSFHTAGVQWPVCGRCSGLYLGAPLGALAAIAMSRRRQRRVISLLAVAAIPTALSLVVEWIRPADVSTVARFVAALPLGAAIAAVLVVTAAGRRPTIG